MRRALSWLIDGVPLDPRSRRAVDETLADWAHEEQEESTQSGRLLVTLRGALSLLRVTSLAVTRETFDFSWCRGLGRRCVRILTAAGIVTLLFTLMFLLGDAGVWSPVLAALIVPILVTGFLPPLLFLVFAWRPTGRAVASTGAATCIAGAVLAFLAWGLPAIAELFGAIAAVSLGPPTTVGQPKPIPVTAVACLVGAAITLASVIARRSPLTSRWWLLGAPIGYVVLMTLLKMSIGLPLLLIFHMGDRSGGDVLTDYIGTWLAVAIVLGVAVVRAPRAAVCHS